MVNASGLQASDMTDEELLVPASGSYDYFPGNSPVIVKNVRAGCVLRICTINDSMLFHSGFNGCYNS